MRRSRFARAIETDNAVSERASIRDALWFDLHKPESNDEASLAEWRVAGIEHMALLLGFTHLLFTGAYIWLAK